MRAAEELRSALVFRALARAARDAGMQEPWPASFAAGVHDEVKHARLCADIGARLGADPPSYDDTLVQTRLGTLRDATSRAAALLLVELAIGETLSMVAFRAARRATVEPLTRAALGVIVADEVRHQRLGWTGFAALWPALDAEQRAHSQEQARLGLSGCERQSAVPAMRRLQSGQPFDPAHAALGVLEPEARVEAFYEAVERLVVPRLSKVGLDGPAAWAERYKRNSAT